MAYGALLSIYDSRQAVQHLYPRCGQLGSTADTLVAVQTTIGNGQPK